MREFYLGDVLHTLRRCWIWVLLAAIVCGALAYAYANTHTETVYVSTAKYYLSSDLLQDGFAPEEDDGIFGIQDSAKDIEYASTLVPIAIELLLNEDSYEFFLAKLQTGDYTYSVYDVPVEVGKYPNATIEDFKGKITADVSTVVEAELSQIFTLQVKSDSPEKSRDILRCITANMNERLKITASTMLLKSHEIVRPKDGRASTPNNIFSSLLVAILAGGAVALGFFIKDQMDTTIRTEEDLARVNRSQLPMLASIPYIHHQSGDNKGCSGEYGYPYRHKA